jgi:HEAT repeat protein
MPLFKPNIVALKAKRDIAGLVHALQATESRTRADAVQALGELGEKKTAPALVALLLADEQQLGEKVEAADALGKIGDEGAIEPLLQAHVVSQRRERDLIDAARAAPDRRYRDGFYVNRIATDEYQLRTTIANALARIGGARAIHALFEMLATEQGAMASSVKSSIRAAIARALEAADARIVSPLCDELKHPSAEARQWAAHCLGEFGDASAADALLRAARNDQEEFAVREIALISLGKIGDARTLPDLQDLMRSGNLVLSRNAKACASAIRQRLGLPHIIGF